MNLMRTRTLRCAVLLLGLLTVNVFGQGKEKAGPEHSNVEIRVTYLKPGDIRHFTTDGTVAPGAQATFRCGRVGNLCEITWLFMERSEFGDVYKFSRRFPQASKEEQRPSQREVLYMGRETLIWQDEDQRVTIKPRPPLEP